MSEPKKRIFIGLIVFTVFLILILVLILRPNGLFGEKVADKV